MKNPYLGTDNKWYWYDEIYDIFGPYDTYEEANEDLQKFIEEVLGK